MSANTSIHDIDLGASRTLRIRHERYDEYAVVVLALGWHSGARFLGDHGTGITIPAEHAAQLVEVMAGIGRQYE